MDKIVGDTEILLSPEESELYMRQVEAQREADTSKVDADYQNEPNGKEQCAACAMFVPGLEDDVGGYCSKVHSYRGPLGMIFPDGWCKFFEAAPTDDELEKMLSEAPEDAPE